MPKDLKSKLDAIEQKEQGAQLQAKVDRLTEVVERQKKVIADQNEIIEQQKAKMTGPQEVPDDIYELRELIGTQRARINELEMELDTKKAEMGQYKTELELTQQRLTPTQQKLEGALESMGQLKTEIAQKNSELTVKDETIKTLASKVGQSEAFSKKLQADLEELRARQSDEHLKEIEDLKTKHIEEITKYKDQLGKLDGLLLDSKLASTEAGSTAKDMASRFEEIRQKYDDLMNKVDEANEEKRLLNDDINRLNQIIDGLSTWKNENRPKIEYFEKLSILMEQEPLFKCFLVIMDVKSIAIEDLQKAIAAPIVMVKKHVQKLQDVDLVSMDEGGKITLNKTEGA